MNRPRVCIHTSFLLHEIEQTVETTVQYKDRKKLKNISSSF
jgi:hypothetical protein